MPEENEKTRIYVSGRKAPIVVNSPFDAVRANITEAVRSGEPFVDYESAGRRFSEGRVAIRVEKIVGLRENLVDRELEPEHEVEPAEDEVPAGAGGDLPPDPDFE